MKCNKPSAGLLTFKCFTRWLHSIVETLTWLLACHWHPALHYYACDCHDILPSWGHHRFDTVQVMGPCVYRKSHAVIHWAHRIWNDQSCCGRFTILLFPPVREFSTSQIAFQVTPLTAGTTSKTLYGITEQHFIHEVLLLHPRIFLFLADIHLYVYIAPVPPLIVIGIYKLDETLVCTQGRVIVLA